ncbi:MAG: iron ABC transporter permease [Gemmatimonadales bacterium]|nr:MAG: iron ABC transporter permease [Gemmatimonadales bacterium]
MKVRYRTAMGALAWGLGGAVLLALSIGAYAIPLRDIPTLLIFGGEGEDILRIIRIPRVLLAAAVGASLALGGAVLQGVFRNPLADPGLIGVSAGASLGAALWIILGSALALQFPWLALWGPSLAAFLCALGATALVWRLALRGGRVSTATLLLAGVALNSLVGASLGFLLFLADDQQLRSLTFWTLGGLGGATWSSLSVSAPLIAAGLVPLLFLARPLNTLILGEGEAYHLGVHVERVKKIGIVGVALAVGAAVAAAGGIGFLGLVVPHLFRLAAGPDHRYLLPGSALGGALLLVLADLFSRTVAAPAELPVGVVTALLGGPFFLWLLVRYGREVALA